MQWPEQDTHTNYDDDDDDDTFERILDGYCPRCYKPHHLRERWLRRNMHRYTTGNPRFLDTMWTMVSGLRSPRGQLQQIHRRLIHRMQRIQMRTLVQRRTGRMDWSRKEYRTRRRRKIQPTRVRYLHNLQGRTRHNLRFHYQLLRRYRQWSHHVQQLQHTAKPKKKQMHKLSQPCRKHRHHQCSMGFAWKKTRRILLQQMLKTI